MSIITYLKEIFNIAAPRATTDNTKEHLVAVYIAKPNTVTAYQYQEGDEDYFIEKEIPVYFEGEYIGETKAEVPVMLTSNGVMEVKKGDYVVTDDRGKVFVMNKEDFEYEFSFAAMK